MKTKSKVESDVWKCSNCFVRFDTQLDFFVHTQGTCELFENFFKCEICQFKTKSKAGILSHQQKHDREKSHIECKYCKKRKMYKNRKTFLVHVNHYHKDRLSEVVKIMENYDKKVQKRDAEKASQKLAQEQQPIPPVQPTFTYQVATSNPTPGQRVVHYINVPSNTQLPQFPQLPDIAQYFNIQIN